MYVVGFWTPIIALLIFISYQLGVISKTLEDILAKLRKDPGEQ